MNNPFSRLINVVTVALETSIFWGSHEIVTGFRCGIERS